MKDPIQGTLDAVREVEIRVGQIRLLWAEAERASAAEVETLRAELARKDEDVERFRARAKQDRRDRFECEESLESARATIWGFVCVATNMLHSAESATRDLKRLRRSNEQVREVLGANHDESPVEAAERAVLSCCSARQVARNECASALFRILRPTKEPPQQGTYVFNTALAEIIEEINALRKDREALNRVRSAVEVKS